MKNLKRLAALMMAAILTLALSVTAFAAVEDTGFSDVSADSWYAEAVMYCQERGLMSGIGNRQFAPEGNLTRAMLVSVLWRQAGSPAVNYLMQFSDVPEGQWYSEAIRWAASERLILGYGDGRFGTNDAITQAQLNIIMNKYTDRPITDNIPGFTGENTPVTRAQTAAVMWNLARSQDTPNGGARVLVAYFSGTGTTRGVAENLVTALGSDVAVLHEIAPEQPYTAADLDYTNSNCRSVTEQHDPSARPAIAYSVANLEQYDVIFLGYPIWNNDAPRIIYTFLESENLSGKTIVPFCTSGGSGIANSVSNIRGLADGAAWMDGRRCFSSDTTNTLSNWANGLGLDFTPAAAPTPTPAPADETKVLVAYFSATNTTKPLAEYIADSLGADIYEIVPQTPYTSADLNYGNSSSRTSIEMNDPNARPAISGSVEDMEQYDVVFIGYPIWWGEAPRIVSTFLESYDFSGKTIVPFCTSNSSGMGSSVRNLHSLTNDADWLDGRRFAGGTSRNTMVEWVNGLGLDINVN